MFPLRLVQDLTGGGGTVQAERTITFEVLPFPHQSGNCTDGLLPSNMPGENTDTCMYS